MKTPGYARFQRALFSEQSAVVKGEQTRCVHAQGLAEEGKDAAWFEFWLLGLWPR